MSKAFTREDDDAPIVSAVRPRAPLPDGSPNYVTPGGARRLVAERDALAQLVATTSGEPRQAALGRLSELEARLAITEIVAPSAHPTTVRLGVSVTYASELAGERLVTIVGVDEADAGQGRIAWTSPLARALAGKSVGDAITLRAPRGDDELSILALARGDDYA
jgi:transcription elongation factor GreB